MKLRSFFLYTCFLVTLTGCQFNQLNIDLDKKNLFNFQFDSSVPNSFEQKLAILFNIEKKAENRQNQILIQDYILNKYDIYGGSSLRALEGEINLEIHIKMIGNKQISKKLVSYKRYKSNELNPFAQDQMIKSLESEMQKDLINQIIFEVSAFEM